MLFKVMDIQPRKIIPFFFDVSLKHECSGLRCEQEHSEGCMTRHGSFTCAHSGLQS
jgi:hypothetical protein